MGLRIHVKSGVEVEHWEDRSVTVRFTTMGSATMFTATEKRALIEALTWEPNTRPGEIGDEDG